MKWIYGKQDWKTLERGLENCFLMTNGLGGFSSLTMTGTAARNDHAVLMACVQAPNHRYNLIHHLNEELERNGETVTLSTQEFADGTREEGYEYLASFTYEDTPVWRFCVDGVEIRKEMAMEQRKNTVALLYEIENRGTSDCTFTVTPFMQFAPKGSDMDKNCKIMRLGNMLSNGDLSLYFRTNGDVFDIPETSETYFYSYDACDGRRESGTATANHKVGIKVDAKSTGVLEIVYEMETSLESAPEIIEGLKAYRRGIEKTAGFTSEMGKTLAKSAVQFVSFRESTGGETILAGYPFFEDWGRDTMIALPGVCISTGQYDIAKKILRTFAVNEKDGLMPNLFPEGGNEPLYNTVDAALLFINSVYLYYKATKDDEFVKEMYPVMGRIIEGYRKGTHFGIHMDEDGLMMAGEGLAQVTWMDVRVGDILPTPRHGKPVEINAYWYNALRVMDELSAVVSVSNSEADGEAVLGTSGNEASEIASGNNSGAGCGGSADYAALASQVKKSFTEKFWLEEKQCLKDLISGTAADTQVRCNQIWAVSMPFTMLDAQKERLVVEKVFEKLYTPYGLRTLEMSDEEFHPYYKGEMQERDMAYHQGTVWTFPLGGYYLAYLKVNGYSDTARRKVAGQLEVMESALREGCIGQLPEIYDGKNPISSKGCFAQAWSVGEILRVYEAIDK